MSTPNDELLRALDRLEAFTLENEKVKSRFDEVKDLLQTLFFTEYRIAKESRQKLFKKELLKSVGVIKSYLPLIEKYRVGTPEEQKFAELVTRTIEKYNESILRFPSLEGQTLVKIEPSHRIAYKHISTSDNDKIEKIFHKKETFHAPPSQEEIDTLKMKAIRLLESDPTFKDTMLETFKEKQKGDFQGIENDDTTVTLMQSWSDLPGEIHKIVGAFKRESRHSIPIKDSFKVFLESVQPGHPYPPQHMGWALPHWLIPSSVIWIDEIPLLQPILERKKICAQALLPKGPKNQFARKLLRHKKWIFDENKKQYLALHQELALTIVKSSSMAEDKEIQQVIKDYFSALDKELAPFQTFCEMNEEMNRVFINEPFERIEEIRLNQPADQVYALYEEEREIAKTRFIEKSPEQTPYQKAKKEYLLAMGSLLGDAAFLLLKLQLSEKIHEKPPPLSDFELKIQACVFKHLLEFLDEIEEDVDIDDPHEKAALQLRIMSQFQSEIQLFATASFDETDPYLQELAEEIVSYYHARFHAQGD